MRRPAGLARLCHFQPRFQTYQCVAAPFPADPPGWPQPIGGDSFSDLEVRITSGVRQRGAASRAAAVGFVWRPLEFVGKICMLFWICLGAVGFFWIFLDTAIAISMTYTIAGRNPISLSRAFIEGVHQAAPRPPWRFPVARRHDHDMSASGAAKGPTINVSISASHRCAALRVASGAIVE